jgi:hypothetical protein
MATSCSYTNFKDVVKAVHSQQLNVTEYVVNCDNACSVMFGPGNPVTLFSLRPLTLVRHADESRIYLALE